MLEEKEAKIIKDKACQEVAKLTQRMAQSSEVSKADWEQLVLALKAMEKVLNIESMEMSGYSGYSRNYAERRDSMGRYASDDHSGYHYDDRRWEDMMRYADPRDREMYLRYRR